MTSSNKDLHAQKIVTLGGGTGHYALLRGLIQNNQPEDLTAITGTWDSGGSSGRLRVEMGVLPSGDIRQCLLACMEEEEQRQVAQRLFNERMVDQKGPLKGHPIGNLIESQLQRLYQGQDRGIDAMRALFRVRAHIVPVSLTNLELTAQTVKGNTIAGETKIDLRGQTKNFDVADKISRIYFDTTADPNPEALESISQSEKIILAPGDLYTSILPHLLVKGVAETIMASEAKVVLVLNIMTKQGETDNFKASDFLKAYNFYLGQDDRIQYMVANEAQIAPDILESYKKEGQEPLEVDEKECLKVNPSLKIIKAPVAKYFPKEHLLRHDPDKLASIILEI